MGSEPIDRCPSVLWLGNGSSTNEQALRAVLEATGLSWTCLLDTDRWIDFLRECPDLLAVVLCESAPWFDAGLLGEYWEGALPLPRMIRIESAQAAGCCGRQVADAAQTPGHDAVLRLSGTAEQLATSLRFVCHSLARDRQRNAAMSLTGETLSLLDQQMRAISRQLAALSLQAGGHSGEVGADFDERLFSELLRISHLRDERKRLFCNGLFSDPAWDILLDLARSRMTGHSAYVSSLAVGAGVALTTALRHLGELEHLGLAMRMRDAVDRRRTLVVLTDHGYDRMRRYLYASLLSHPG
jgi:DNA-binding MarR family transcriptional regulator